MINIDDCEAERLELQSQLDGKKTSEERNRMGQFATPTALAREILRHGIRLLPEGQSIRFLDPGIGTGSFYSALLALAPEKRIESATGYEIDPHYGGPARLLWKDAPLDIRLEDFAQAHPIGQGANLVISNPPYVRHHHMDAARKAEIQRRAAEACGVRIGGLAGLYCYFMGLAHPFMSSGGIAGWLIPSEFMEVNYGRMLKRYLLEKVTLLQIHRYDPTDVQFDDALVSSAVVWFRKAPPPEGHSVCIGYGGTLANPASSREVPVSELAKEAKWTRYPQARKATKRSSATLGDFFEIKRGLVTGDNSFFIMERDQIEEIGLPMEVFRPVLPGSRHIPSDEIKADADGLPLIGKQLFLLDIRLPEDEINSRYPALKAYLEKGRKGAKPVSARYICQTRKPWYSQEKRPAAPIICTYMGRSRAGAKPFRFILNESRATACNTYLLLYPKSAVTRAAESNPDAVRISWQFMTEIDSRELMRHGRVYGGGLHKLEPRELGGFPADRLIEKLPEIMCA